MGENGRIVVTAEKSGNRHIVTVEDNGNGFDTTVLDKDDGHSVGIKNTVNRVGVMCSGTLDIESAPGKGTKVTMIIPE